MTPDEFKAHRSEIAHSWGIPHLSKADLGRALGMVGRDPGQMVGHYETGKHHVPPHVEILLKLYLGGTLPPEDIRVTLTAFRPGPSRANP